MPLFSCVRHKLDLHVSRKSPAAIWLRRNSLRFRPGLLADDVAVLDRPQLRIAVPAGQVLAVEKVFDILFCRQVSGVCTGLCR